MRLIDADKLKYYGNHIGDEYEDRFHDFQYVDRDQIDKAPSIDIVHCGECKHRKPSVCVGSIKIYECDITGFRMHDLTNHFCSYGERLE